MSQPPLVFKVPGPPVPCGRPRFYNGRTIPDQKSHAYQEQVAHHATLAAVKQKWPLPAIDDGCGYSVRIVVTRESRRGDVDNFAKSVLDGITRCARVWWDDLRVVEVHVSVEEGDEPGVLVMVSRLEGRWESKKRRRAV